MKYTTYSQLLNLCIEEESQKLAFAEGHDIDLEGLLSKAICTVVKVLEDDLLNAMEGTDVGVLERKGLLLYQVAPDVILQ